MRAGFLSVAGAYIPLGNFLLLPDDDTFGNAPAVTLGVNGGGYVDLAPGYYHVYPTNTVTGATYPAFIVLVPDLDEARLVDIIVRGFVPGVPSGGGVGASTDATNFVPFDAIGDGTAAAHASTGM